MDSASSSELQLLIEQSSLSTTEKSGLVTSLSQLEEVAAGKNTADVTFDSIFISLFELETPASFPLAFLSLYLDHSSAKIPIFTIFQYYYRAWHCLPESLKSKLDDTDNSGQLLTKATSQLKASYTNLLSLFSPYIPEPAIIDAASGVTLSHQTLFEFVRNFSLPIDATIKNPIVVLALPNGPLLGLALIATVTYYTAAPVNTGGGQDQFRSDVLLTDSKHLLATEDDVQKLGLREKWIRDAGIEVFLLEQAADLTFKVKKLDPAPENVQLDVLRKPNGPDDMALILFTSGTTGKKKRVPASLHNIVSGIACVVHSWGLTANDVCLNMMPLNHVGGIVRNLFAPVLAGGSTILCPAFDPNMFWDLVGNTGGTWYYASPSMHLSILAEGKNQIENLKRNRIRLICNAAGGLLPSLAIELRDTFDCIVLPSYGMTECMPICTPPLDYKLDRKGTSGKSCGPQISILNNDGVVLPTFQTGHINVRGGPTFEGYLTPSNEIDTSCFDSNDYFDTGDLGYLDEDGYLYITGRSKEVINRGGELISPLEVEEAIIAAARTPESPIYQRVDEVLTFSAPHQLLQEVVGVAVVVPPGQKRPDLRQMQAAVKTSLHPSKWPVSIVYMDDLPKGNNKLLRIGLADRLDFKTVADGEVLANRHFEAVCPPKDTPLKTKISNSRCHVDCDLISDTIRKNLDENIDVFVGIHQHDGFPEIVLAPSPTSTTSLDESYHKEAIDTHLKASLHHYHLPSTYVCLQTSLPTTPTGDIDTEQLAQLIHATKMSSAAALSATEEAIRSIFVEILFCSSGDITPESDFFDMGGDSLSAGRFLSTLRRKMGVTLPVDKFFTASRVCDLAAALDDALLLKSESTSETCFMDLPLPGCEETYSSTNPLLLVIQLIPILLVYPVKASFRWILFMYSLAALSQYWDNTNIAARFLSLVGAMAMSRLGISIAGPFVGIVLKWIIIGRYKEGMYPMWGPYHTRWWLVQKILMVFGKGMFCYLNWTRVLYYRMLGAKIGSGVTIEAGATLGEYDLLDIGDNVRMDPCVCRPFAVERNTSMYLGKITIGKNSSIGLKACVAPGAVVEEGYCIGPNSSSHEMSDGAGADSYLPSRPAPDCHPLIRALGIIPVQVAVLFIASLPWMGGLWGIVQDQPKNDGDELVAILLWWATPGRVGFHYLARQLDTLVRPLVWFAMIVLIKKILDVCIGKSKPGLVQDLSQMARYRSSLLSALMPPGGLHRVSALFGTHYEITSMCARALGAKIGSRVYWPGTGPSIQNFDLIEIGDDVVFGSRSHLITSDGIGNDTVKVGKGSMVADRAVLLPGTTLQEKVVLGSGAITERNETYTASSVWIGNHNGKAICLSGSKFSSSDSSKDLEKGLEKDSKFYFNIDERSVDITTKSSTTNSSTTNVAESYPDEKTPAPSVRRLTDEEMALPSENEEESTSSPFGRAFYEGKASYYVIGLFGITIYSTLIRSFTQIYWDASTISMIQCLAALARLRLDIYRITWYRSFLVFGLSVFFESSFVAILSILALSSVIAAKWLLLGRRKVGNYDWDKSSYCQRWQIFLTIELLRRRCFGGYGVIGMLTGTHYVVMYFRAMGANIGKDCALFAGGKPSLVFTEPELLDIGDRVAIDDASLVSHINSRGNFSLNRLRVGSRSVLRTGSRLLSGAQMGEDSCLLEHTLIMAGDMADEKTTYQGWPASVFTRPRVCVR